MISISLCLKIEFWSFIFLHRLREHIADKKKLPILIFPEGKRKTAYQVIVDNKHQKCMRIWIALELAFLAYICCPMGMEVLPF